MASVGKYPVLSHERQLLLAKAVKAAADWPPEQGPVPPAIARRAAKAREKLIATNMRLVVSIAKRYTSTWKNNPELLADIVQDGCLGLDHAITKFDPARGYCFSTYATWWVRQYITRGTAFITDIIRRPEHIHAHRAKLLRTITQFEQEHGFKPSIETLSDMTGISQIAIRNALVIGDIKVSSADAAIPGTCISIIDSVAAPEPSPDDELQVTERQLLVNDLLDSLPERDRDLLRALFIDGLTQKEYAQRSGLTRRNVSYRRGYLLKRLAKLADSPYAAA